MFAQPGKLLWQLTRAQRPVGPGYLPLPVNVPHVLGKRLLESRTRRVAGSYHAHRVIVKVSDGKL